MKWLIISVLTIGAACLLAISVSEMFNPNEPKDYMVLKILIRSFVLFIELSVFALAIKCTILL